VWDTVAFAHVLMLAAPVRSVAWSRGLNALKKRVLFTASQDETIRMWQVEADAAPKWSVSLLHAKPPFLCPRQPRVLHPSLLAHST
jgi:hypothetical protein